MGKQLNLFNQKEVSEKKEDYKLNNSHGMWTLDEVINRLHKINRKGFISIPPDEYRKDEGVIGQLLEREFSITENNISMRDLGSFELKGMRKKASTLTLCHKTTSEGLTPNQVFYRFGYVRPSNRDTSVIKKKLFSTINGEKPNSLDLILGPNDETRFSMYYQPDRKTREYICTWDIEDSIRKIDSIILVLADTKGKTNARDEQFHYVEAWLYNGIKDFPTLISNGIVVVDFCIDQVRGSNKGPHDRGPHIRIPKSKLKLAFNQIEQIL